MLKEKYVQLLKKNSGIRISVYNNIKVSYKIFNLWFTGTLRLKYC